MGNRGCRRKTSFSRRPITPEQDDISDDNVEHIEDFDGPTPDSYDKLLAWMVEMAENDDSILSSPTLSENLSARAKKRRNNSQQSILDPQRIMDCPVRQESLESNRSSRCSKSRDDLLDLKARFRSTLLSRQSKIDYSDGTEEDGNMFSDSFDRVSEQDCNSVSNKVVDTGLINTLCETNFARPARKLCLQKNHSCTTYCGNISDSLQDLLNVNSRRKSKSLITMRKVMSETRNQDAVMTNQEETVVNVLDDNLLDRNMSDILFAIESLWPKAAK